MARTPSSSYDERRNAPRVPTWRRALFLATAEPTLPAEGEVADLSPGGMRILCNQSVPPDRPLDIVLETRDLEGPGIHLRGQVVHSEACGEGLWALGIKLFVPPGQSAEAPPLRNPEEARDAITRAARNLAAAGIDAALPHVPMPLDETAGIPVRLSVARVPGRRPCRGRTLLLVAVVLGLLAGLRGCREEAKERPPRTWLEPTRTTDSLAPPATMPQLESIAIPPVETASSEQMPAPAEPPPHSTASEPSSTTETERFITTLHGVDGALSRGEAQAALERLDAMLAGAHNHVPKAWLLWARDYRLRLAGDPGYRAPPFEESLAWDLPWPLAEATVAPTAPTPSRSIEIHQSAYLLVLMEAGQMVAAFPVGLGRDGATPLGTFSVANKLVRPDWYDRGRAVPAGDPENPLGDYWVGLGTGGAATSYGIHPTNEADSIGGNRSRGCVRMRPEDAKAVFDFCVIGTPVAILP